MGNIPSIKLNKEYLKKLVAKSGMQPAEISMKLGKSANYITNIASPSYRGGMSYYTARALCTMLDGDFDVLAMRSEPKPLEQQKRLEQPKQNEPEFLRADDDTLRQLVDQLYAMNAKLNVLYKMVAKIEEAVFNGTRV